MCQTDSMTWFHALGQVNNINYKLEWPQNRSLGDNDIKNFFLQKSVVMENNLLTIK